MLDEQITPLDQAAAEAAEKNEKARLLMTQPGIGPTTSLAFVLTIGDVSRFHRGKQVASYLGLIPRAIRLHWMLRTNTGYPEVVRVESSSRAPLVGES